jgi:hypothetical protein
MLAGLRPAELCEPQVCGVDFAKHVIHVSQTVLPVHSFDSERFGLGTGPPKTSAGDRRIPIPAWLCGDPGGKPGGDLAATWRRPGGDDR